MKSPFRELRKLIGRSGIDGVYAAYGHKVRLMIFQGIEGVAIVPPIANVLNQHRSRHAVGLHEFQ